MNEDKPRTCYRADGQPKRRYTRRRDAQRDAFIEGDNAVMAYHCENCGGWHIGNSISPSAKRRMQRDMKWVTP